MAQLDIIVEGHPLLRQKALKIRAADESLRRLAADMHETMLASHGVGLAAPQVGLARRLFVMHVPENYLDEGQPEATLTLINPEIIKAHGRLVGVEACLSIPGWVGEVERSQFVTVRAIDLYNRPLRIKAHGIIARVIQHEVDHLDGILYVDRITDRSKLQYLPEEAETAAAPAGRQ
jgi:peptide deformylase